MPLAADPTVTFNAKGNARASASLAASATDSSTVVDVSSSSLGAWIAIWCSPGSVAGTNGISVSILSAGDSTPNYDTVPLWSFVIAQTASTVSQQSILVPTGKFKVAIANLDATNAVTVAITSNPIA